MDIVEVKRVVSNLKGRLFKKSNSFSIGMLKSHFRGSGLQFLEHRLYEPGDDTRFIDWKLLAKTSQPYLKTFEEERNVEISVVIDAGPTMFTGVDGVSKIQAAIEICCLIYLIAEESKDFVRAIILGHKVLALKKENGEKGIIRLISELEKEGILNDKGVVNLRYPDFKSVDEEKRNIEILKHLKRKREVVVLSDLLEFQNKDSLKKMIYNRSTHFFRLVSPLDDKGAIPYLMLVKSRGPERGKSLKAIKLNDIDEENKLFGKRVKNLNIEGRYLEKFVREMI